MYIIMGMCRSEVAPPKVGQKTFGGHFTEAHPFLFYWH